MSEGSRGGRSYWSKYRSMIYKKILINWHRRRIFPKIQKTQNTHVRRKFTCHNLISTSTQPVECSLNTNSPDQCDTGNSKMSITENDLCEIDDTVVTCSDETLNVSIEAAEVLILDSDTEAEHETENMEN